MSQGVMYVEILPSTKGIGKAVEKDTTAAFKGAEKSGNSFFDKVKTGVKRVGLGVAAVATTVAAIAIKGGISRALNIEDATSKLKGLGHDTKSVDQIMTDALASVKGTAFGLDAAATTAASAVAAGIKPGKELEGYLRLTADAATIAGVSMEEMGDIMNKVSAKGKVSAREINQFTERGIPVLQMLAEEYGVTAEEMSKMVSSGEVDAKRFRKALEDNLGGAALESGNTTRGAFANMRAALSRLGLAFVGDGLAGAKDFFNEVTVILDGLTDRIGPWVKDIQGKLGGMFKIEGMGDRFLDWLDEAISSFASGPIPQLMAALAPVIPALVEMAKIVGGALGDAFKELGEALAPILPLIAETLVDAIVQLAPPLTDLLVALLPIIPPLVELLAAVVPLAAALVELLVPAITWVVELLAKAAEPITEFFELLSGGSSFEDFLANLDAIADAPGTGLRVMLDYIDLLKASWGDMVGFFTGVKDFIVGALSAIGEFFRVTWETIGLVLGGALKVIWGLVTGNMALVSEGVSQGLNAIKGWWDSIWGGLSGAVSGAFVSVVTAVATGISAAMALINGLPGKIQGALAGAGTWLVQAGRDIIQGLINGVGQMVSSAVEAVKNVGGQMLDGVKSFLGIKSPSRVFRDEVGKMVGLGLLDGIEDSSIGGRIDSAVNHLVSVPDGLSGSAFPESVVLLDQDGSILSRARTIASNAVDLLVEQMGAERRRVGIGG